MLKFIYTFIVIPGGSFIASVCSLLCLNARSYLQVYDILIFYFWIPLLHLEIVNHLAHWQLLFQFLRTSNCKSWYLNYNQHALICYVSVLARVPCAIFLHCT